MITSTSLKHPTMRRKIIMASINVLKHGYSVDHVANKKGQNILAIRVVAGKIQVTDQFGSDLTQQVSESF